MIMIMKDCLRGSVLDPNVAIWPYHRVNPSREAFLEPWLKVSGIAGSGLDKMQGEFKMGGRN